MNKKVLNISLILLMASTGSVFAQQGFGTNRPAQSAAVDIVSPNKGLLIPRVALQADNLAAPITNPATSLIVYNNTVDATKNLEKGFYFWNGTKWEPFTTATTDLNTTNTTLAVVAGNLVLTDSDGNTVTVPVSDIDTDKQQISTFEIGANNIVTLTLERGGSKTIDLSPYFNSTKLADGINTTVSGTGTATDQYKVNVATATENNLGVVQIGSGINVTNGVISVPAAPGETTTVITDALTGTNKHKIADYKNETTNTPVNIYETVTALTQNGNGISYTNEEGTAQSAKVVSVDTGNLITVGTDFGALFKIEDLHNNQKTTTVKGTAPISVSPATANATGNTEYIVSANVATSGTVGVVMPGTGMTVDTDGKLNVTVVDTDDQQLSLTGNTLKLDRSTPDVDLSKYDTQLVDGTNTTVSGNGSTATPYAVNVTFPAAPDGSETVINQGTNVTVSGNGTTATPYVISSTDTNTKNQTLAVTGSNLVLTDTDNNTVHVPLTDLDKQQLSLTNNTLALTNGGSVDLTPYLDNTDNQQLSLTGNTLKLDRSTPDVDLSKYDTQLVDGTNTTVSGNGSTATPYAVNVTFPAAPDGSETVINQGTNVTVSGNGTTATPYVISSTDTNTKNQTLAVTGSNLVLTDTDSNTVHVPLTDLDKQQLSLTNNTLALTNGGSVDLTPYLDNTDNQQLSLNATTHVLSLTNGGAVDLSALAVDTNSKTVVTAEGANVVVTSTTASTTDTTTYKVEVKNAMPKFFYMPSVLIDTSAATGTVNLYTTYTGQFAIPLVSSASAEAGGVPTLTAKELDFYVTYFDDDVIDNIVIDADGVMTYDVIGAPTNLSFVNIVFKIRNTPKP